MKIRIALAAWLAASCASAFAQAPDIPRTADGRPDFQGVWESRWLTPLERMDGTTDAVVFGKAADAYAAARSRALLGDGVALHPDEDFDYAGLLPAVDGGFRTSLIVEPANGKRPQSQIAKDAGAAGRSYRDKAENPEALSGDERCIGSAGRAPLGVTPGSMFRQIVQTPTHVMIYTEEHMAVRVIGIGASPRPAAMISLAGDSVGMWDGDALVVVTTLLQPQLAPPGIAPFDQKRRVTERFRLTTSDQIDYEYTLEDNVMLTEPMRVQYQLIRTTLPMYEAACHEGNYSLPGMMLGARLNEARTTLIKP